MKAGGSFCLMLLALNSGCVNLSKPKAVQECATNGSCSDDPSAQTGGASGGEPDAMGGSGGDDAASGGSTASTGGSSATGGITGSGGLVGSGGTTARDGSAGAGGVVGSGGGAIGLGGVLGSGGNSSGGNSSGGTSGGGGTASTGGATGTGGGTLDGGSVGTGGITVSGGNTSAGGAVVTGGVTGTGGKTGSGGVAATGGTVATGGSGPAGCGTTKSTFSQTFNFALGIGSLVPGPGSVSGSQVNYVTAGPKAKPALCSPTSGCAALSVPFASGAAAYTPFALAVENFTPAINLVGSTVTFSLAVDNPGTTQVPIQIQAYAQGDVTSTYAWTKPVTVGGASLDAYAAKTGFQDLTLPVTDYVSPTAGTKYCASVTAAIGIQVMNTAAITSGNAGTVTVYISKITITPGP
jgi:hypothetical protein